MRAKFRLLIGSGFGSYILNIEGVVAVVVVVVHEQCSFLQFGGKKRERVGDVTRGLPHLSPT